MSDWPADNTGFKVRRAFYLTWIHVKLFCSQLPKNSSLNDLSSTLCFFSISRVLRCVFYVWSYNPSVYTFQFLSHFCPNTSLFPPFAKYLWHSILDGSLFSLCLLSPFLSTLCPLVYPLPNVDNISGATMDKSGKMLQICQRLSKKREKTLREKLIKILTWQLCNLPSEGAIEEICVIGLL